jgi:N-acetylmuramoyl-L-alanine amidase
LTNDLPLRSGSAGDAVRDIQRRLTALGYDVGGDKPGSYDAATERAVYGFQERRGLRPDGICGPQTWTSLVEAGFRLGDRLLYVAAPMLRGDDVGELQRRLNALGFDAGREDAILGDDTAGALTEFQRNVGITADGICGPETWGALIESSYALGDRLLYSRAPMLRWKVRMAARVIGPITPSGLSLSNFSSTKACWMTLI